MRTRGATVTCRCEQGASGRDPRPCTILRGLVTQLCCERPSISGRHPDSNSSRHRPVPVCGKGFVKEEVQGGTYGTRYHMSDRDGTPLLSISPTVPSVLRRVDFTWEWVTLRNLTFGAVVVSTDEKGGDMRHVGDCTRESTTWH